MSLFSTLATQRELAHLCRSLGTSLHSGIDLVRALQMAGKRGTAKMSNVLQDITAQVKSGTDLTSAIESHGTYFPELFADIVQIGEHAGALPEALKSLAEHYENNIRLRKEFIGQITIPLVQLAIAIVVIAGLIFLLGLIGSTTGVLVDPLGWGLVGTSGALTWIGFWVMGVVSLYVFYKLATQTLSGQKFVHRMLLSIPVVGNCMTDFAIARFSWAFHLTQNAGMPIGESIDASLRATSNGAFIASSQHTIHEINNGASFTDAIASTGLYPMEFIQTVDVAETTGTVPEQLYRLSPQFEENARRSLRALAVTFGWICWIGVAIFIIFVVFSIVMWYVNMLNDFVDMANGV